MLTPSAFPHRYAICSSFCCPLLRLLSAPPSAVRSSVCCPLLHLLSAPPSAICSSVRCPLLRLLSPPPSAVPVSSAVPVYKTSLLCESQDTDPLTNRDIRRQLNDSLEFMRQPQYDLDTVMLSSLAKTQQVLSRAVEMVTEPGEDQSHNATVAFSVALETFLTECSRMGNPQPG